jgi:DNA-binding HxlR family transcriptional regulator
METRRYDDPCGVARALDVVGQRWALLVVRELLLGPKRFRDLLRGLDGMSPNVLSQRLKDLEAAGVVARGRPGVYGLTGDGAALEPVLVALGRWGRRRPLDQRGPMSPDALLLALRTTFGPAAAGDLDVVIDLRVDGDQVAVTVRDGRLAMVRGAAPEPAATVIGDVPGVRAMVYREGSVADAVAAGTVTVEGDLVAVQRLVDAVA